MIISKIARSRRVNCCYLLQQICLKNDSIKVGSRFGRESISSSSKSSQSTSSANLSPNNTSSVSANVTNPSSLISDHNWPNLLFTDDTWSEVDNNDDERFEKLTGSSWEYGSHEEKLSKSSLFFKLIFRQDHREKIVNIISEELNLDLDAADEYLNYLRINRSLSQYGQLKFVQERRDILQLYKKIFTKQEIYDSHQLFSLSLKAAQFRISFYQDCGFKSITPAHIVFFNSIELLTESTLEYLGVLDPEVNIVDCLLSYARDFPVDDVNQLRATLMNSGLPIGKKYQLVRKFLLEKYEFTSKLPPSSRKNCHLSIKAFSLFCEITKKFSLLETYSPTDLEVLFSSDPDDLKMLIDQVPKKFGQDTLLILMKYPKVLKPKLLENLTLLLGKYSFNSHDLDCHPQCLTVEPDAIESRIENLTSLFGPAVLKNPSILSLLHLNNVEVSNLVNEMKENGFYATDLNAVYNYFINVNNQSKNPSYNSSKPPRRLNGLNRELGVPQEIIKKTLHRHPYFHMSDNRRIRNSFNYLANMEGLTQKQLYNGLILCLYDVKQIEQALEIIKGWSDYEEWKVHPFFLETLTYIIEKMNSFDGSAALAIEKDDTRTVELEKSYDDADSDDNHSNERSALGNL